jgi:hypothetical protein
VSAVVDDVVCTAIESTASRFVNGRAIERNTSRFVNGTVFRTVEVVVDNAVGGLAVRRAMDRNTRGHPTLEKFVQFSKLG